MLTDWVNLHGDAFRQKQVLVTGGAGFIGSHLSAALVTLGARVLVIDDLSGGDASNLRTVPAVHFVRGTILDPDLLAKLTAGCDLVFHQAALGSVPASISRPRRYFEVNVIGTSNVLEAARTAGVRRVMFAASSSAYGDSETLPKIETLATLPKSPYAATKVAGEALCRAYAASLGLDTAPLRYFNVFGPRQNANSAYAAVIAAFAAALRAGKAPTIYGDGTQSRDFTFVDNVVHANLLAARNVKPIGGEPINIACGVRITVAELATAMARQLGRADLLPVYAPERTGDVLHSQADLGRAKSVLGYEPIVDFARGLETTLTPPVS